MTTNWEKDTAGGRVRLSLTNEQIELVEVFNDEEFGAKCPTADFADARTLEAENVQNRVLKKFGEGVLKELTVAARQLAAA